MNEAILGAIIGTIPGTLAAILATWTSVKVIRASIFQNQLAVVTEHMQWLRDKRSDVYVEMLTFVRESEVNHHLIQSRDVDEEWREATTKVMSHYKTMAPEFVALVARADAYAPGEAGDAFADMFNTDSQIWQEVYDIMESGDSHLVVSDELQAKVKFAERCGDKVASLAVHELQEVQEVSSDFSPKWQWGYRRRGLPRHRERSPKAG